jgi:hypothetical protein
VIVATPDVSRDERGDVRIRARVLALHAQGALFCPNGHPVGDTQIGLDQHTVRCSWQDPRSKEPCREIIYVIAYFPTSDGRRLTLATSVTFDEVQRMRPMNPTERLEYLNLSWKPLHAD